MGANEELLTVTAVERETGLSADTLRVWERRYGFPQPLRDSSGRRRYPKEQVERLRQIKRLVDAGFRPGKLVGATKAVMAKKRDPK
jgi:DNA-binding transcriptional MerR regulator